MPRILTLRILEALEKILTRMINSYNEVHIDKQIIANIVDRGGKNKRKTERKEMTLHREGNDDAIMDAA